MYLFWGAIFIIQGSVASAADLVCDPSSQKSALIVIDMQPGFVTRSGHADSQSNQLKLDMILNAQLVAIEEAKKNKIPIVFFEYAGEFGATNEKLKAAVKDYKHVSFITKTTDGMLDAGNVSRPAFVKSLKHDQIGTLIITGANGGACVKSSIEGALAGNCTVVADTTAIGDFNYEDFIYPYIGYYKTVKADCQSCKFVETSSSDVVSQEMNAHRSPSSGPSLPAGGVK